MVESSPFRHLHHPDVNRVTRTIAHVAFAVFLMLLLGTNSVAADGGPLTWWPLLRLPAAGGAWETIGPVALLPLISVVAWIHSRRTAAEVVPFVWGWPRLTGIGLAIGALATTRVGLSCLADSCSMGSAIRLAVLLALAAWVYLFVVNEQPDLLWVIAPVIVVQSMVGIGQFLSQSDLGLQLLGEHVLDPAVRGISIVWRDDARWLRGYGLTAHPNALARTLVPALLMVPILGRNAAPPRRLLLILVFVIGMGGMMVTLSRWAWACLLLGLAINTLSYAGRMLRGQPVQIPRAAVVALLASLLTGGVFLAIYGETVAGRAAVESTATEAMSINERRRDTAIAWQLLQSSPVVGVGYEGYLAAARPVDPTAATVHMVPLWWGVELGMAGTVIWVLLVVAPLWRRGVLGRYAPYTALWLGFWLMGLLYTGPNPIVEIRSTLMAGLVTGVVACSWLTSGAGQARLFSQTNAVQ